jgi:ATP-binding protein involved in chromosome partitioning
MADAPVPKAMKQAGPRELEIEWTDGKKSVYDVRMLRLACPCAQCVDEMSGKKLLSESAVPPDVKPVVINPVGRYAIHIDWSDGHRTGIYTYAHLRSLG